MIRFRRKSRSAPALDLTPLIDVVFRLLIFFLLTSAFINPGIIVQLPAAQSGESGKPVGLSVTLDTTGRLFIGPREVSLEELRREAGSNRDVNVAVWGDSGVPYGRFVQILDICRTSGLERVVLMVRPESRVP